MFKKSECETAKFKRNENQIPRARKANKILKICRHNNCETGSNSENFSAFSSLYNFL